MAVDCLNGVKILRNRSCVSRWGVPLVSVILMLWIPTGCHRQPPPEVPSPPQREIDATPRRDPLLLAEAGATAEGREILKTGRTMTLARREIIRGGCWDYANAVYNRAGYPAHLRRKVFKSRKSGPYADLRLIHPGDWLYYINRQYGDTEHSAIFVRWTDFTAGEGLMLSYGGERRNEPARYRVYDVSRTYMIIRPSDN